MENYILQRGTNRVRQNRIDAITYTIIGLINLSAASNQKEKSLKEVLTFIGVVNVMAGLTIYF